jgi:hypothetical protein
MEEQEFTADPQQLRSEAEKEQPRRGLHDYADTIRLLKEEKGFSFREIAAWLQERSIKTDHNAVWRTYSRAYGKGGMAGNHDQTEQIEQSRKANAAMPWEG